MPGYSLSEADLRTIFQETGTASTEKLIAEAKRIGEAMAAADVPNTQFRSIFGTLRQIQRDWKEGDDPKPFHRKLQMLKPKLAYQARRVTKAAPIADSLTEPITQVGSDWKRFQTFMDFAEATLAYLIANQTD
ncbi:MAG: type III-A CRISPR-associated protein Csm2 [Anaerolineae bacterium]|nr:type III-A CRISPR-associated protein Csm2 [Anaerolineae bacterium]